MHRTTSLTIAATLLAFAYPAVAQRLGAGGTMIDENTAIPHCAASLGTVSLVEDKAAAPPDAGLPPQIAAMMAMARAQQGGGEVDPMPLLKLLVAKSGCFGIVDRGAGFNAVQRERELANAGQVTNGSTTTGPTLIPSDYVLVAQVVYANGNAGGAGGMMGGFGGGGGGFGGATSRTREVQTMLTLTAVKTGVQVAVATGSARKRDINWAAGGLAGLAIGGLSGYHNTDIGKMTAAAVLDAFDKIIPAMPKPPSTTP